MKINVIVPFYKNHDTIERLLMSLDDQDYKNFDVTIVSDGPDKEIEATIGTYLEAGRFGFPLKFESLPENKGAPAARNFGAQISGEELPHSYSHKSTKAGAGEILFFLDADCQMYPGIFSEFITQFKKDPKVAFVYGNYRFENKYEFHSQPFDAYLLETMNYIPTMSPIRRSVFNEVGKFIEGQPYFQDWSLFYRAAKAGFQGKFIKEFIFTTKTSTEDNISGTKGLSLDEKAEKFRDEHGIDHKPFAITTWGAPLQAIQRAKILGADYVGPANGSRRQVFPVNYQFKNWKGTYIMGVYSDPLSAFQNHLSVLYGEKKVYHFIGTDVFQMMTTHPAFEIEAISNVFKLQKATVFANSPRMVRELASVGIESELLYTPIYNMNQYQSFRVMPEKLTIAVYYSDTNPMHSRDGQGGLSNIPLLLDVAYSMPDVNFKFFGGQAKGIDKNVEWCGRIPEEKMNEFINSCSGIIRSTIHDGFPQLPIQFMLAGRHALVSCPDREMAYADKLSFEDINHYENSKNEVISKIYALESKSGPNPGDTHGYYKALMNEDYYRERVRSCFA
jgi:glycosyltransferase involved in cell wall biosynthesis